jgi:two-component system, OmpR family, osmolarity sensor histidine kinase EnvZ
MLPRAMHRLRKFDSLFTRLLVTQTLLALGFVLMLAALFYVERSVTVARLAAERWAPALRQRAALPDPLNSGGANEHLLQQPARPTGAIGAPSISPRIAAFEDALRAQGVPVQETAVTFSHAQPTIWLHVVNGPTRVDSWLGMPGADMLPNVPWRIFVALGLGSVLLVGASWWFTRRLTQPLRQLRANMLAHEPRQGETIPTPLDPRAAPELRAIATAHAELLQRYRSFENERALLLAGVSHDLRSPLARIRMAAELLPDLPGAPDVAVRRAAIVRNTETADRLVGSFLDHVRAGELRMNEEVDLVELVHQGVAAQARPAAEIAVQAPPALLLAGVNSLLLERLLCNLIDNAFVHGMPPVCVQLLALPGGGVSLAVGDHGPGIALAQRDVVMQAFARGDSARSSPGLGLGLATVARVAQRLGGQVSFERVGPLHWVRVSLWPAGKAEATAR